ncbi:MAG TPA: hypothetical protein VEI06_02155 [Gemmatimonadaceae bacterium]|nr:hypothetical protein [Gemmatimonadaceae bacterium]
MREQWQDPEDAGEAWRGDQHQAPELAYGDVDAWRGEEHLESEDPWRSSSDANEWPEWDAGPEYHMWKKRADEDN